MKSSSFFIILACAQLLRCVGPDIGAHLDHAKSTTGGGSSDCSFCLLQPQVTLPVNHATSANTLQDITIAPIAAEACEYAFTGAVNTTTVKLKSAGSITAFTPITTWPLDQSVNVAVRCFDSENVATAKVTAIANADFTVSLAKPQVLNPWSGYISTSNLVRFKSSVSAVATSYEWEVTQGATTVYSGTAAGNESVIELPFPPGAYGSFNVRTRYRDANLVYSPYSDVVSFVVKDRSAGTTVYQQDFTAMPLCGDKTVLLLAGCVGVNILGTYPSCDSTGWSGGGGNVWFCNTGFENTVVMQTNNSNYNSLPFYSAFLNTVDVTNASLEVQNHQHGNSEDAAATVISCRVYPAEGNDGFAFVIYPYRTSGVNVEIRNRRFLDNAYEVLASAFRSEAQAPTLTWFRFDCLDTHFTGYYKNTSGKWIPLIQATSAVVAKSPHRIGVGPGQGNQIIKLRNYNLNVKSLP
jgi:hypothetical protein